MRMVKVGDRVKVSSEWLSGAGKVVYIDEQNLFQSHLCPIQVDMDEADSDGHKMKRFSLKEVSIDGE